MSDVDDFGIGDPQHLYDRLELLLGSHVADFPELLRVDFLPERQMARQLVHQRQGGGEHKVLALLAILFVLVDPLEDLVELLEVSALDHSVSLVDRQITAKAKHELKELVFFYSCQCRFFLPGYLHVCSHCFRSILLPDSVNLCQMRVSGLY